MAKPFAWLQHHWCLYICWLIQFPAMCCLALYTFSAYTLGLHHLSGAEGKLGLGLCCALIVLYIYQVFFYFIHRLAATQMLWIQVFDGAFVTYLGVYFWRLGLFLRWPPGTWTPFAKATWLSLPLVVVTFYILLVRSLVVWYRIRKHKRDSPAGKNGEELDNLLSGENHV